jgi:hypothetical protein
VRCHHKDHQDIHYYLRKKIKIVFFKLFTKPNQKKIKYSLYKILQQNEKHLIRENVPLLTSTNKSISSVASITGTCVGTNTILTSSSTNSAREWALLTFIDV